MSEITRVGVDLAKAVIQVHAVNAGGKLVTNRQLSRDKFLSWCGQLPAGCTVAMEACGGAHHWARKLIALGLNAKISERLARKRPFLRGAKAAYCAAAFLCLALWTLAAWAFLCVCFLAGAVAAMLAPAKASITAATSKDFNFIFNSKFCKRKN